MFNLGRKKKDSREELIKALDGHFTDGKIRAVLVVGMYEDEERGFALINGKASDLAASLVALDDDEDGSQIMERYNTEYLMTGLLGTFTNALEKSESKLKTRKPRKTKKPSKASK